MPSTFTGLLKTTLTLVHGNPKLSSDICELKVHTLTQTYTVTEICKIKIKLKATTEFLAI